MLQNAGYRIQGYRMQYCLTVIRTELTLLKYIQVLKSLFRVIPFLKNTENLKDVGLHLHISCRAMPGL